ncbi:MAG TPA: peptidase C1 [Legionellales bacterium]|nr:peptidase C1 [Legionellales bacterium]
MTDSVSLIILVAVQVQTIKSMLKSIYFFICLCVQSLSYAQAHLFFDKVIHQSLHQAKIVSVMKVKMTPELMQTLERNASKVPVQKSTSSASSSIQLGMNHIPVADQGYHGSCVTFAIIEAISAIQSKPYSELCTLSLGQYLENNGYKKSGWNGQMTRNVLARIEDFGIVNLETQKSIGCGGLLEYPLDEKESQPTNLEVFKQISEPIQKSGLGGWSNYYDVNQWINQNIPSEQILNQTKLALHRHNRVIISVLLPIYMEDFGAIGTYHSQHDTWLANQDLMEAVVHIHEIFWLWGGHAMIITGYDNEAIVYDKEGQAHQGVFTLRNSWGSGAGDHGDFYMTYDYFKLLAVELNELSSK